MRDAWLTFPDVVAARRRTLQVLVTAQVVGALGYGAGPSVGVLLAEEVTRSEALAGIARASTTIGAAVIALPLGMLAARAGRRRALTLAWAVAAAGSAVLVASAALSSTLLLVLGMVAMGAGTAAGLQARFAATDLAEPAHRGRSLSLVVWVGTVGAVLGPNLGIPGEALEARTGLPPLSGAFALAAVLLGLTAVVVGLFMRPEPLDVVRRHTTAAPTPAGLPVGTVDAVELSSTEAAAGAGPDPGTGAVRPTSPPPLRLRPALREVRSSPAASFALLALVLSHLAMVSVMTMTPVHLAHQGHGITVVGLTISLHVLGMFAFAPVMGALADRLGAVPTILLGQVVLLASAVVGAVEADRTGGVVAALFLLGVGWSMVTVPAATLLSGAVATSARPLVQGASDSAMNAAAAVGAIASGPLLAVVGFAGLAAGSALCVVPVVVAVLRRRDLVRASPTR
ncbi:MFS transporter [Actinotalea sp. Marseille-Q4924]|uniref:MFS transporter n=1 Tax=Actinotalea sp. Marseille-Q4924 TaxID=2866571 RepID=UPI001CE3F255|nr:MFS transporter [Actinotalea sp. Marseille-Q4924]